MSKEKRSEIVQEELANLNNEKSSKEVAFNPQTGELEIVDSKSEVSNNATIVSDVAVDGFAN